MPGHFYSTSPLLKIVAERTGSRPTAKGKALRESHQQSYTNMLVGRSNSRGLIAGAEYIGNSVYGVVRLTFSDGSTEIYSHRGRGFRPRKQDFGLIETVGEQAPVESASPTLVQQSQAT